MTLPGGVLGPATLPCVRLLQAVLSWPGCFLVRSGYHRLLCTRDTHETGSVCVIELLPKNLDITPFSRGSEYQHAGYLCALDAFGCIERFASDL